MASLKNKAISGMFWSLLQNAGGKGITFVVMIILARLLTPEAFGLVGMLMIFIHVSQALVQAGFSQALIQKTDTDEEDYSSVFWINLIVSILIYCLLFFAAPWISDFYEQPVLVELTRVLSLVFVINAFSYVQEARLSKEMRFKTLAIINVPSTLIGGIVSIVMAFMGFGVWSIITLQLVTRFVYAIQIWIYSKWIPLVFFSKSKAKKLFSFGSNLMITGVISTIFDNINLIVIGKFFPVNTLGYYQNANNLVQQPTRIISFSLNKVTFSAFSAIQDDNVKLRTGYKKTIEQMLFWICPIFVLAGILAEPLFSFVFGEKWLPAVPYFQILCVVGIFYPLNLFNLNIVNVKGRSDLFLKLAIVKRSLTIIGIVVSIPLGIWYLIGFQAVNAVISYYINSFFSGKYIDYPMQRQLSDIAPFIITALCVGALVWGIDKNITVLPDVLRVLIGFVLGGGVYFLIAKFRNFEPYNDIVQIIKSRTPALKVK